jgi:hypothetical protein
VNNLASLHQKFPKAIPALNEAITFEMAAGESLFIPAFTWVQMEWLTAGISVNHFGWANGLSNVEFSAVAMMEEIFKQHLLCTSNLKKNTQAQYVARWISVGRHPRGVLPGSPVLVVSTLISHFQNSDHI